MQIRDIDLPFVTIRLGRAAVLGDGLVMLIPADPDGGSCADWDQSARIGGHSLRFVTTQGRLTRGRPVEVTDTRATTDRLGGTDHTGGVLSLDLAHALKQAGLRWTPDKGDWFAVPDRELDDQVFVVSDMVIETLDVPQVGRLLAFNGTTEWALDSLAASEALWLPREDQLRELLGDALSSLERLPAEPGGYAVTVQMGGDTQRHVDVDADAAYARALLARLSEG